MPSSLAMRPLMEWVLSLPGVIHWAKLGVFT